MRDEQEYNKKIMWIKNPIANMGGSRTGIIELNGTRTSVIVGRNEDGWEHVSIMKKSHKLPTWDEMCLIKDIFWSEEEEVVQIHPRQSEYVNITDALHLWRPVGGDWSKLNERGRE